MKGRHNVSLLKFRDEAERREVAARHGDVYRRARDGEITVDEAVRLSQALLQPYRKRTEKHKKDALCAPDGQA